MPRYILQTDSIIEPVTLDEARKHVRIDNDYDDSVLTLQIAAARKYCEQYTSLAFINQIWSAIYDFKDFMYDRKFYLNFGNIQQVNSINAYDNKNDANLIPSNDYMVSGTRITLNDNYYYQNINFRYFDSFIINYTVGFGVDASFVPQPLKQAILLLVGHWYENRGALFQGVGGKSELEELPLGVRALLDSYRLYNI